MRTQLATLRTVFTTALLASVGGGSLQSQVAGPRFDVVSINGVLLPLTACRDPSASRSGLMPGSLPTNIPVTAADFAGPPAFDTGRDGRTARLGENGAV